MNPLPVSGRPTSSSGVRSRLSGVECPQLAVRSWTSEVQRPDGAPRNRPKSLVIGPTPFRLPLWGRSLEESGAATFAQPVWATMCSIPTFGKPSRLVSHSKLLHHVLPDLVVPIDRENTGWFLGLVPADLAAAKEAATFELCSKRSLRSRRSARPSQYVGTSRWNSSLGKVIDNAIGRYRRVEKRPWGSSHLIR